MIKDDVLNPSELKFAILEHAQRPIISSHPDQSCPQIILEIKRKRLTF